MTDRQDPNDPIEIAGGTPMPVGPGHVASSFDATVVDFGHYQGRRIEELADSDPSYLYWLARHPSGIRYRAEIARVMGAKLAARDY